MESTSLFIAIAGACLAGVIGFLLWYFGRETESQNKTEIKENPNAHRDNIYFGPKS